MSTSQEGHFEGLLASVPPSSRLVELAQGFVAIPSPPGQERALGEAFLAALKKAGAECLAAPDEAGNILARIAGDRTGPTILFLVALDNESPLQHADWVHPPYAGELVGKRLYGAGIAHHKGAMAALLGMVEAFKDNKALRGDVLIAALAAGASHGGVGIRALAEHTLPALGLHADFAVMAQASSLDVVLGHRGLLEMELVVFGRVASAAAPWLGHNAVAMARWVLEELADLNPNLPTHPYLDRASITPVGIESGPLDWGGVPDRCCIRLDRRFLPSEAVDAVVMQVQSIVNRLTAKHPDFHAELRVRTTVDAKGAQVARLMHPMAAEPAHALVRKAVAALRSTQLPGHYGRWAFCSDVGYLAAVKGITAIGFGPGDELLSHTPQESLGVEELHQAACAYTAMAWAIAGP